MQREKKVDCYLKWRLFRSTACCQELQVTILVEERIQGTETRKRKSEKEGEICLCGERLTETRGSRPSTESALESASVLTVHEFLSISSWKACFLFFPLECTVPHHSPLNAASESEDSRSCVAASTCTFDCLLQRDVIRASETGVNKDKPKAWEQVKEEEEEEEVKRRKGGDVWRF